MQDQLKTIKHDILVLVTSLGGKGYSAEATPTNLLQLLKTLISKLQEKVVSQDKNVGFHGNNVCVMYICSLVMAVENSQ